MLQLTRQLYVIANKGNLKIALEKFFFMLLTVNIFGHENGFDTSKPIQSKTAAVDIVAAPTTKIELMKFLGSRNFYPKLIDELHVNLKRLHNLLHDNINIYWNIELEALLWQIETSITRDVTLTLPNANHPFFKTADSRLIAMSCVFFQLNDQGKLDTVIYNSRIFTALELKLCTTCRETIGIVSSLTIYEHTIIGFWSFLWCSEWSLTNLLAVSLGKEIFLQDSTLHKCN